jgi:hypothetical protein
MADIPSGCCKFRESRVAPLKKETRTISSIAKTSTRVFCGRVNSQSRKRLAAAAAALSSSAAILSFAIVPRR